MACINCVTDEGFWEEKSLGQWNEKTSVTLKLVEALSVKCCKEFCETTSSPQPCLGYTFHEREMQCMLKIQNEKNQISTPQFDTISMMMVGNLYGNKNSYLHMIYSRLGIT